MRHAWIHVTLLVACSERCTSDASRRHLASLVHRINNTCIHRGDALHARSSSRARRCFAPWRLATARTASRAGVLRPQVDSSSTDANLAGVHDGPGTARPKSGQMCSRPPCALLARLSSHPLDMCSTCPWFLRKFQVVANRVEFSGTSDSRIESSGSITSIGVNAPFPPGIVKASTDDLGGRFSVSIQGTGLGTTTSVALVGRDNL